MYCEQNSTGNMRCETHVSFFVKIAVKQAVEKARKLVRPSIRNSKALLFEDCAPGHFGDKDKWMTVNGKVPSDIICNTTKTDCYCDYY